MKTIWKDLPEKKTVFTVRNATLKNLNTGKIIQHYSRNTRIDVVQKCITEDNTYYRTSTAAYNNLNLAFEARDFGLPNEAAPSVPTQNSKIEKVLRTPSSQKQKVSHTSEALPKDGGVKAPKKSLREKFLALLKRR